MALSISKRVFRIDRLQLFNRTTTIKLLLNSRTFSSTRNGPVIEQNLKGIPQSVESTKEEQFFEKECPKPGVTEIILKTEQLRSEVVTIENQFRKLAEVVTPLWEMPYLEQLKVKYENNRKILKALGQGMKEAKCAVKLSKSGLPCHLHGVRPSPILEQYRNKDEFCVHMGVDGDPKTVGFFVGRPKHGGFVCVRGDQLIITKDSHKEVARLFEEYIKTSELEACHRFDQGGFWRHIRVRSNSDGDLMAIVIVHPQEMSKDAILEEQEKLKDYFVNSSGRLCDLKSLWFQTCQYTKCTNEESPYRHLHGTSHLYESLCGMRMQISPDSFVQVNTPAAEVLYDTVREVCYVDTNTTVLDICCGTGIIGHVLSSQCEQVIGIDMVKHAVADAKINAKLNGIFNTVYYDGKAEDVMVDVAKVIAKKDCVAVANPSRSGLHRDVITTLRKSKMIHQLIYVSCQPNGIAMQDFVRLCSPKNKLPGQPFVLREAIPVDLFPHTNHCELVLVFEHNWS